MTESNCSECEAQLTPDNDQIICEFCGEHVCGLCVDQHEEDCEYNPDNDDMIDEDIQ